MYFIPEFSGMIRIKPQAEKTIDYMQVINYYSCWLSFFEDKPCILLTRNTVSLAHNLNAKGQKAS